MRNLLFLVGLMLISSTGFSQVGINNTSPKASLDITATNQATPSNTDGILIPRVNAFPASQPGADQQGMMVYLTTTSGGNPPGFYYWDNNSGPAAWVSVAGADNQNITGSGLSGTNLTIGIENGSSQVVDLSALQDGTGTDNQSIDTFNFNSATNSLTLEIENDGVAAQTVNLSSLINPDLWYQTTTINSTTDTNQSMYRTGNVGIGLTNADTFNSKLHVKATNSGALYTTTFENLLARNGVNIKLEGNVTPGGGTRMNLYLENDITGGANKFGIYNRMNGGGSGTTGAIGLRNWILNTSGYPGAISGVSNSINNNLNGNHHGTSNTLTGTGTGDKIGSYNYIYSSAGGTHYGVYSYTPKATGYAGYFIGRMSFGNGTTNRYLMPPSDGAANFIMQTNGSGQVSFVDPTTIGDGTGTDNQNITGSGLTGTNLTIGIENGTSQVINLASLQDGTGTDDQTIDTFSFNSGTNILTLEVENDGLAAQTVNLSSLQDGIGTDDQNLTGATLTGTSLQIDIENGSSATVNLASLQDGIGTDDQTIDNFSFNSGTNILTLEVENDGLAAQTVNLSSLQDGTGTDDQNLTGATLTGTSLQIDIENGSSATVNLASLQDGTGTDEQTIDTFSFNSGTNILTLEVENDGVAAQTVDLSTLQDGIGTDDQNLTGATLTGTSLQIDIENGNSATVNLASLQDGTGTDDQTIDSFSFNTGTNILTLEVENDGVAPQTVDLSTLQDGIGTDDQNLTGVTLTGTSLQIDIENGNSATVNLASLQDGTGTDEQTIDTFSFNTGTNILTLEVENDGVPAQTIDLSSLQNEDADWYEVGSTTAPNNINDNMFTQGNVAIGKTTASYPLDIETSIATRGVNTLVTGNTGGFVYGQYVENSNSGSGEHYGSYNILSGTGTGNQYGSYQVISNTGHGFQVGSWNTLNGTGSGIHNGSYNHLGGTGSGRQYGSYQNIINTGSGEHYGSYNRLAGSGTGNQYGSYQEIVNSGSGDKYCTYNTVSISGGGTGSKYGSYNHIYELASGTHYGVYSKVTKYTGYAGYFIGRVSIGTTTANHYILPSERGTTNQIMQTNGGGNVSWVNSNTIGTDNQNITGSGLAGTNLTIGIENGTSQVINLSSLQDGVGATKIDELTDGKSDATGSTIFLGNNAGVVDNGTANNNIGIGLKSLLANTSGGNNIAIGVNALDSNINANFNIAIGTNALNSTTNNGQNLALGYSSMASTVDGNSNVVLGHNALTANINGDNNVIVGHGAGIQNNGSGNIFIGKSAGASENTTSNKLFIDNSNTIAPLIYGDLGSNEVGINWNSTVALPNTLSVNGDASKASAGAWLANSDRRLKKEIKTIEGKTALEKINQLRGVTYKWNDDKTGIDRPTEIQYGFIAQELMEVFPSKVSKDKLGYYQTAYGDYDALFVQAFKELTSEITILSEKNKQQEQEIETLKKQLLSYSNLEARLTALEDENNSTKVSEISLAEKK